MKDSITSSLRTWENHIEDMNVSVKATAGPVSIVQASIDYITDIEPTQERVTTRIDANDKE